MLPVLGCWLNSDGLVQTSPPRCDARPAQTTSARSASPHNIVKAAAKGMLCSLLVKPPRSVRRLQPSMHTKVMSRAKMRKYASFDIIPQASPAVN
jgi:hypothetical protein